MILFLSNADTEILALRVAAEGLPGGFPAVRAGNPSGLGSAPSLDGVSAVVVRLLGGRRAWEAPLDELRSSCAAGGVPLLAFGGEAQPDAELAGLSTVPAPVWAASFEYLAAGGPSNIGNLLRYLAAVLDLGDGGEDAAPEWAFAPPEVVPDEGVLGAPAVDPSLPTIGVIFYRAHLIAGNTQFVADLCTAIRARGANAVPVWCYSLRPARPGGEVAALEILRGIGVDAVVTTVLASGSSAGDGDEWDATALASLGVPVVQAMAATRPRAQWEESSAGLSPVDVAMTVAIPEFDGRLVTVPFSFKEVVDDGEDIGTPVTAYRTAPDRVDRVAGVAVRLAGLRRVGPADKRVALVLSAYPTKRSRIGNAVALDTPASVVALLHALREAGYRLDRVPADGDALMAELADGLTYDEQRLTPAQTDRAAGRWSGADYSDWFAALPKKTRDDMVAAWGEPPGDVFSDHGELVFPGIDLGNVLVAVQPPRGFGQNPVAVYHSPDLPPTHHYLAFYRWLDQAWGADAVVHVGKHGSLEWLPGKGVGLSSGCFPDAALGDLPLVYPFVVNDPGEGTQAKRRAHAVVVDHLLPPMTRADSYGDIARLESLLDEHARASSLDPAKLPAVRQRIWDLMVTAELHRDLGVAEAPAGDDFDDLILHVDGYLCELKDAQIRGGLHVLGQPPVGEAELDMVNAL
ncbi:MAG TPA: cobaltochelatase subunit CobN, partial [Acidimicrobiales bacterium]|nr:cobaltochelatase subunit CobN [Acidimicrobiales bacterium]